MAAPWCAGREYTCAVQNIFVAGGEEADTEVVLGGGDSHHTVHEPTCGLLQAMRVQNWGGSFIGMRCYLDDLCYDKIEIGKNVTISYGVYFACHGRKQGHNRIVIKDGAYIGMHSTIIAPDDIEIGERAIIGAGALVNKSVPDHSYAVGVPIRILDKKVE